MNLTVVLRQDCVVSCQTHITKLVTSVVNYIPDDIMTKTPYFLTEK